LGYDPVGDKEKRDDYRTPEGNFYICGKNSRSQFHKSLRLSYPNAEDAARGLRVGLIDRLTYKAIVQAIHEGRTPPQNTKLGGDIMLHGGGAVCENWTWGCIALDNDDIDELFDLVPVGTMVKVLPGARDKSSSASPSL
jgi:murein L,D-transpeptidase YafK